MTAMVTPSSDWGSWRAGEEVASFQIRVAKMTAARHEDARNRRRDAIKRGAPEATAELVYRDVIYMRDAGRCRYCGHQVLLWDRPDHRIGWWFSLDHVRPVSQGGAHRYTNIVACCVPCNDKKADQWLWSPPTMSGLHSPGSRTCSRTRALPKRSRQMVSATSRLSCLCRFM